VDELTRERYGAECTAVQHGSTWAYSRYGCRCPDAVATMRALWRRDRRLPRGRGGHGGTRDAYVDEVAVRRAAAGEGPLPNLTPAERRMVVDELTAAGFTAREIAVRLQVTVRTVCRARARSRSSPNVVRTDHAGGEA
jgi:DNA-binding CsgD family transcriptional regulator